MDEDGFVQCASVANMAHMARVDDAADAIARLEAPDPNSSDPEYDGRRLERVPGGWMVLNASKYRELVTREAVREQTRIRVARHRAKSNGEALPVTRSNDKKRQANAPVTQSDTDTDTIKNPPTPLTGGRASRPEKAARPKGGASQDPLVPWDCPHQPHCGDRWGCETKQQIQAELQAMKRAQV